MQHHELKNARERKGLTLAGLQDKVGVREQVLAAIERGAFGELPAGLYGRHAVRAYAGALGLDPDALLAEVAPLLPAPEDPLDGLARVRGIARRRPRTGSIQDPTSTEVLPRPDHAHDVRASRETMNRVPMAPTTAGDGRTQMRIAAASAIDGAILCGLALALLQLTALVSGLPAHDAGEGVAAAVVVLTALIGMIYFVLLGGIRNATPGRILAHAPAEASSDSRDMHAIVGRAIQCALRESSIIVQLIVSRSSTARVMSHAEG